MAAALVSKHQWLVIACDSCGTVIDLDLTVKRRDPNAPIRITLDYVQCPRCNGHGPTRVAALSRYVDTQLDRFLVLAKVRHGMLVPNGMDGVDGLTQPQIKPGQTFVYEFAVLKSGSFMYHLHADEMVQAAIDHRHALKLGAKVGLRVLRW